jgi:outer membrane receptor protein involved in Fe transport
MAILQFATLRSSWGWTSLAAMALIASSSAAEARDEPRIRVDIDAASLPEAIVELSREARVSIGTEGVLPRLKTRPLHGSFTVDSALAALLRGSGYKARKVGNTAWRIEPAKADAAAPPGPGGPPPSSIAAEPIVVRATKRRLTLQDAPIAVTLVPVDGSARFDPRNSTQRIAERVEGLSLTGQGPGRNRMFLRGVADSPFGGKSQATVAILLDDARLIYVAPDPDIRLVDVDRVEVLKGPQGSLYGTGALGGIYRIVTRRADPSTFSVAGSVSFGWVANGDLGRGGSAVVNLPLVRDVVGLRLVAYGEQSPGWLDTGDRKDSNDTTVAGLRAGLGIDAGSGWRADLTGFGQWLQAHDSNYTYRAEAGARPAQVAEPNQNDLVHGSIRLAHEGAAEFVLSSGYTMHDVDDRFDATEGAASFGLPNPRTLDDDNHYRLWDSEARISGSWGKLGWLGGVSHVESSQHSARTLRDVTGTRLVVETVERRASESALFGEASLPLSGGVSVTLGGRMFHTALHEDRATTTDEAVEETRQTGVTPSASLSWRPRTGRLLYVRYGSAVRQGGTTIGAGGDVEPLDEDELMTIEGGWREAFGPVEFDLGLYHSWWRDVQSDVLLPNGLVETANVGQGAISGAELSLKATLAHGWRIDGGAMIQSAVLTRDTSGFKLDDRRLPVVPAWTLRGTLARDFALGPWDATLSASARYVGATRLSFDPALDRRMGNYLETNLVVGARRGSWAFQLEGRNLANSRGDSFAYGNPLRIFSSRQFVRQEPLSIRLSATLTH